MVRRSAVTLGAGALLVPSEAGASIAAVNEAVRKGSRLVRALASAARAEIQWWRDARAAHRELSTLGCRSNAELDLLLRKRTGGR
jgi:hypothetical protein